MFAVTKEGGMLISFLDICRTVVGPDEVPIPYPNSAKPEIADPACDTVLICGMPALNFISKIPISEGDEPGELLGVVSEEIMGEASFIDCSANVILQGSPAVTLSAATIQNTCNCEGLCESTNQVVVDIME
jgi:hypothetical protein